MQDIISKKSIGERLRALRLAKDLSQAEVSEALGLSRSHYSQVELGKQFPSYSVLSRVAEFYNKDYEWILHGQDVSAVIANVKSVLGSERKAGVPSAFTSVKTDTTFSFNNDGNYKTVLLRLTEHLTYLRRRNDEEYVAGLPEFSLPLSQLASGVYRAFEVEGDSMEGVLCYEDIAVGKSVEDYSKVALSNIYIIVLDRSVMIRRITGFIPETDMLVCVPDNRFYQTDHIHVSDIKELWEVKARVSFRLNQTIQSIAQYFNDFEATIHELKDEVFRMKASNQRLGL